jgi:hypothetical protein
MNAKTAKKLRKIAMGMVVAAEQKNGKPIEKTGYVVKSGAKPRADGHPGTIYVASNTFKGAYKALKKAVRTGKISTSTLVGV